MGNCKMWCLLVGGLYIQVVFRAGLSEMQLHMNMHLEIVYLSPRQFWSELHQLQQNGPSLLPIEVTVQLLSVVAQYIWTHNPSVVL